MACLDPRPERLPAPPAPPAPRAPRAARAASLRPTARVARTASFRRAAPAHARAPVPARHRSIWPRVLPPERLFSRGAHGSRIHLNFAAVCALSNIRARARSSALESQLAPGLVHHYRHGVGQVQAAVTGPHGYREPLRRRLTSD